MHESFLDTWHGAFVKDNLAFLDFISSIEVVPTVQINASLTLGLAMSIYVAHVLTYSEV